jgi:hypothetical protein
VVFFIQSVTVTTDPLGMTPSNPGTPVAVSHEPYVPSQGGFFPFRFPLVRTSGGESAGVVLRYRAPHVTGELSE